MKNGIISYHDGFMIMDGRTYRYNKNVYMLGNGVRMVPLTNNIAYLRMQKHCMMLEEQAKRTYHTHHDDRITHMTLLLKNTPGKVFDAGWGSSVLNDILY